MIYEGRQICKTVLNKVLKISKKGLSQEGTRADFSKNLRTSLSLSLSITGLSNEPNFGRIHLAGRYLYLRHILIIMVRKKEIC
jgi:hypothetical protein